MLFRATVTRTTADGVYVIVPQLAGPDAEVGPAPAPAAVAVGDLVLVGLVDGSDTDVAIVGAITIGS